MSIDHLLRKEDERLITGHGKYSADWYYDGMLYAFIIRSPYAHASIGEMDFSAVESAPGVIKVLNHHDVDEAMFKGLPTGTTAQNPDGEAQKIAPMPILAKEKVLFVGQPVAIVLADTLENAINAAELAMIDYDVLDAVTDYVSATLDGAPELHSIAPHNRSITYINGNQTKVDEAFRKATYVSHVTVHSQRLIANPMEPRAVVANYDAASDIVKLHVPTQGVMGMHGFLSHITGLGTDKIEIETHDVGGSFGIRSGAYNEYALAILASKLLQRPIKWVGTRSEVILSDWHGRALELNGSIAIDESGNFLAIKFADKVDLGAFNCYFGSFIGTRNISITMSGVYQIPALAMSSELYYTNTVPVSAYRGAGRPDIAYAIERLIDHAANEHGFDKVALRKKNFIPVQNFPYTNAVGTTIDSGDFIQVMDRALELSHYTSFEERRQDSAKHGKLRGIGLAYFIESSAAGNVAKDQIRGSFTKDGELHIFGVTGASGQGHETSFTQIAADTLGYPVEKIQYTAGQADQQVIGNSTGGSRTLYGAGSAVKNMCQKLIEKYQPTAAEHLGVSPDSLSFENGNWVSSAKSQSVTFVEILQSIFRNPDVQLDDLSVVGEAQSGSTYPNGCHVAEVEVDPNTGITEICSYTAVDDTGVIISPKLVEGQIHGGVVQGIGQAFYERTVYDQSGQLLTGSLMDYALPKAGCITKFICDHVEVPTKSNLLGAKGVGESGCSGSLPSLSNAMVDALKIRGITNLDMPFTPSRVWGLLNAD
jgi:carbon-monoxide dehydrogenase large subunit